jgi:hypothetical protein
VHCPIWFGHVGPLHLQYIRQQNTLVFGGKVRLLNGPRAPFYYGCYAFLNVSYMLDMRFLNFIVQKDFLAVSIMAFNAHKPVIEVH